MKYLSSDYTLIKAEYNFTNKEGVTTIDIETNEKVKIVDIEEKRVLLQIERTVAFLPLENTFVRVIFEVRVETSKKVTKDEIAKDIKAGENLLGGAFSDASLAIAAITSLSPFRTVITPPLYDVKEITVE